MTKIESRSPVELDELPPWDDSDEPGHDDFQQSGEDTVQLTPYTLDSEQRTLVGMGPLERARRSRPAIAPPESQRMPQSEPPGPFIADDNDDNELLPTTARRGRNLGKRALAVSGVVLVPLAALALMRGLSAHQRTGNQLATVAAARVAPSPKMDGESQARTDVATERDGQETQAAEAPPAVDAKQEDGAEQASERPQAAPKAEKAGRDAGRHAVKLADVPPASGVVDRSNGDENAGTIEAQSTPPSNVILDGRPLGKSPRVVRVAPGPHTVVFIHPLYGRRWLGVNVRSGATTDASTEF